MKTVRQLLERRGYALALLFLVVATLRFDYLVAPDPHYDEGLYLEAGELHRAGGTPYAQRYFNYPPPLVQLLGLAGRGGWTRELVLGWRVVNLVAIAGLAWLSAGRLRERGVTRWLVALVVASSPVIGHALDWGNLSPLVAATALGAFAVERRRPWVSALGLGASVALKPVALAGAAFLSAHRLLVGHRRTVGVSALGWPLVAAALLAPGTALLPGMLAKMSQLPFDPSHLSIRRLILGFGIEVPPAVIATIVLGLALALAYRHALSPDEVVVVAPVVSLLALPVVWAHTFALTLPLQVAAIARLSARLGERARAGLGGRDLVEVFAVGAPIAAIHAAASEQLLNDWSPAVQVAVCAVPTLAPTVLLVYLLRARPCPASRAAIA